MNCVKLKQIENTVELERNKTEVRIGLISVETVQYGLMGMQPYEGVEPIERNGPNH